MKYNFRNNQGQSLLEVILAVAIFALIGAALSSMVLGSFNSLTRSTKMTRAQALADEAAEAIRSIKGGAWNRLDLNRSAVATTGSQWIFQGEGTSRNIGPYTRTIDIEDVCRDGDGNITDCPGDHKDVHTKKVVVNVEWEVRSGVTNSVTREVYLSNWDSRNWTQTDWSGGDGQDIWSDSSRYDSSQNIATGTVGQISLLSGDTRDNGFDFTGSGVQNWSFSDSASYSYDPSRIEVADGVARLVSGEGSCEGTVTTCSNIGASTTCSGQNGCSWDPGNCYGTSSLTCTDLANAGTTCSDCGCSYTPGICSNNGTCGSCTDSTSCNDCSAAGCGWNSYSCPLVESWNGEKWIKEHEAFPFSVFESAKNTTFDSLPELKCSNGEAKIRIHETLPETTYLEDFQVFAAENKKGFLKPDLQGRPRIMQKWMAPDECSSSNGGDCKDLIQEHDSTFYEPEFDPEKRDDWLEVEYKNIDSENPKLYLVARKQHFYTTYFDYMVHIMGEERYPTFSGISDWPVINEVTNNWWEENLKMQVEVWNGQSWEKQGSISAGHHMPGSGADDFLVSLKDLTPESKKLKARLRFTTGSFGIDYIALDDSPDPEMKVETKKPQDLSFNGQPVDNFNHKLHKGDTIVATYDCQESEDLFFSISGYYQPKKFIKEREKDIVSAWSEYLMFFLGGKDYVVETAARKGLYKEARSLEDFSEEELRRQKEISSVAYAVFAEIILVLVSLVLLLSGVTRKKVVGIVFVAGTVVIILFVSGLALVNASGSCGGSLDCGPLGEVECTTCGQCTWSDPSCSGSIDDCSSFGTQALCQDDCGCSWDPANCYDDPEAVSCSDVGNESECSEQSGCSWVSGSYPTTTPAITPVGSFSASGIETWDGFSESAVKNGGEIYYQLSSDNGSTWQYWNGSNWAEAGSGDHNIASVVDSRISSFDTSNNRIKFRAFLASDGSQQVELDNVSISYSGADSVWEFFAWDVGPGEETPGGTRQETGGNPGGYAEITIPQSNNDEIGGYWQQSFTNYENNPANTALELDYRAIDHNGTPDISELRVYIDTSGGEPVNQVGSSINIDSESDWIENISLDPSSAITATGTYYLKLAYWVETPGGGQGPFAVGFDNVDLDLGSGEHPKSGQLVSSDYDTGTSSAIQALEWNEDMFADCDIQVQIKTADTQSGLASAEWSGPDGVDGDETDYFSSPDGHILSTDHNGDRWLRYKTFLFGDGYNSPVLEEINLNYK